MGKNGISTWILAARPKTLTAAFVPVVVGTALAYGVHGTTRLDLSFLAFICALLIQVGTNLINDAIDFKKGADTEERLGPKRVTQSGLLSSQKVLRGGVFCFLLAICLAIPLVLAGGFPLILIGILSLLAGYAYTGGPYPLAYLGLGDFFVLLFFGWIAVGGVYFLNTGTWDFSALIAGTQVGLLATVMIAINNLRDFKTDSKVNKNTLAVRFGAGFVRMEIASLCSLPFLLGFFWFHQGVKGAFFSPMIFLPLSFILVRKVWNTEPGAAYNRFLAQGAALHLGFGLLLSFGMVLR